MNTNFLTVSRLLSGFVLATIVCLFMASSLVYAQNTGNLCSGANFNFNGQGCNKDADGKPLDTEKTAQSKVNKLINSIVTILSIVVGIVAVIMIIIGGFRYITSSGDSAKVTSARNTILYAIVGLVVVVFAQLIVKFVLNRAIN